MAGLQSPLKKNDNVVVITGRDRGKKGRILVVEPAKNRVIVEGVNVIKKHTKPNPQRNVKGGIVEREDPIHVSNVALIDPRQDKPTRVGRKTLPDGSRVRVARRITGHILKFNKPSRDGSGKGNIQQSGDSGDIVYGVIFKIDKKEKLALDRAEGLGHGYDEKTVTLIRPAGESEAVTYYATQTIDSLKPYDWYLTHVIVGAKENQLPEEYISKIELVESMPDPNPDEHDR